MVKKTAAVSYNSHFQRITITLPLHAVSILTVVFFFFSRELEIST